MTEGEGRVGCRVNSGWERCACAGAGGEQELSKSRISERRTSRGSSCFVLTYKYLVVLSVPDLPAALAQCHRRGATSTVHFPVVVLRPLQTSPPPLTTAHAHATHALPVTARSTRYESSEPEKSPDVSMNICVRM